MDINWSQLAKHSLVNILDYIEGNFNRLLANFIKDKIVAFTNSLVDKPRIGTIVEDFSEYGEVRRALYKKNRVYYLIDDDSITVIIIWDGRQDSNKVRALIEQYLRGYSDSHT